MCVSRRENVCALVSVFVYVQSAWDRQLFCLLALLAEQSQQMATLLDLTATTTAAKQQQHQQYSQ